MNKLFLLTLALVATVMLFASPIVAEASAPPDSPTVEKVCASCHAVLDSEIGTDLGQSAESKVEQISMEVSGIEWLLSAGTKKVYAEVTPFGSAPKYIWHLAGSDHVPT